MCTYLYGIYRTKIFFLVIFCWEYCKKQFYWSLIKNERIEEFHQSLYIYYQVFWVIRIFWNAFFFTSRNMNEPDPVYSSCITTWKRWLFTPSYLYMNYAMVYARWRRGGTERINLTNERRRQGEWKTTVYLHASLIYAHRLATSDKSLTPRHYLFVCVHARARAWYRQGARLITCVGFAYRAARSKGYAIPDGHVSASRTGIHEDGQGLDRWARPYKGVHAREAASERRRDDCKTKSEKNCKRSIPK